MLAQTLTFSRVGMNSFPLIVEVDVKPGLPFIAISGMASQEVRESRERLRPAITNCGFTFPQKKIIINFSPADSIKTGTHYDLAIAVAILKSSKLVEIPDDAVFFGELSLSGEIRWVRGILPMVMEAARSGEGDIVVPYENIKELEILNNPRIKPLKTLLDIQRVTEAGFAIDKTVAQSSVIDGGSDNFSDISGQEELVDSFVTAAAGHHHMLIVGPPGSGKTMCASRMPSIMSSLLPDELLELNMIYSIASDFNDRIHLNSRPFRAPHNSSSTRALIGGGVKLLPGEVSLAHRGVLFLDEFLEFRNDALQALRTVIEKKEVYISLRNGSARYPADFILIAATNPCECGFYDTEKNSCICTLTNVKKYRKKLKNPLTDRIDIQVKVKRLPYRNIYNGQNVTDSEKMKEAINLTREICNFRYKEEPFKNNSEIPPDKINYYCKLDFRSEQVLEKFIEDNLITARGGHKILRIARTIADIDKSQEITVSHLIRAINFRFLDTEIY